MLVVTDIRLIGWLVSNAASTTAEMVALAVSKQLASGVIDGSDRDRSAGDEQRSIAATGAA